MKIEYNHIDFCLKLKLCRLKNHLTLKKVAAKTKLSLPTVYNIETPKNHYVSLKNFISLLNLYNIPLDYIPLFFEGTIYNFINKICKSDTSNKRSTRLRLAALKYYNKYSPSSLTNKVKVYGV